MDQHRTASQSKRKSDPSPAQVEEVNVLLRAGQLDKAGQRIATMQAAHGQPRAVLHLVALHHQASGRFRESLTLADRLIQMPGNPIGAHVLRSMSLISLNQLREGVLAAEELYAAHSSDPRAAICLATARHFNDDPAGCLSITEAWMDRLGDDGKLNSLHSWALEMLGRSEEAERAYYHTLEVAPQQTASWMHLVKMGCDVSSDALQASLRNKSLSLRERSGAAFALGEVLKRRGEHQAAFDSFERGNRMIGVPYDPEVPALFANRMINAFTRESIERVQSISDEEASPIFILGMPRSGSSLIERILSSQGKVTSLGESRSISGLVNQLPEITGFPFPQSMNGIDRRLARKLARQYLSQDGLEGNPVHFTDKSPGNLFFIGLIFCLFPKARVIHSRRNPLDTGLSCYFNNFGPDRCLFSYSLENIKAYTEAYQRMMTHWSSVLPGRILDVDYESVVTHGEDEMRRILDFCGLEWDDSCLNFHESDQSCFTASAHQVNKPLYTGSVGVWKKYEQQLAPLLPLMQGWDDPLASPSASRHAS